MTGTDSTERCHCPRDGHGNCPHCGRRGNADHRARCHRAAAGELKPPQAVSGYDKRRGW